MTDRNRVATLVRSTDDPVVLLERIARGGGATNWWLIPSENCLDATWEQLRPGSRVSAYLSEYLREMTYFGEGKREAERILAEVGVVCFGQQAAGCRIDMDFVTRGELAEFEEPLGVESRVIIGEFPLPVDDGETAVTFVLPDADGLTRRHPY